jgi:hypothetical protein
MTGRHGVATAVNAVPGGAASAIRAVADGGRLTTITSDPPSQQRGITICSIYVRADGNQLRKLAQRLGGGQLEIPVAASYRLADAAQALAQATGGHAGGAIVLTLDNPGKAQVDARAPLRQMPRTRTVATRRPPGPASGADPPQPWRISRALRRGFLAPTAHGSDSQSKARSGI